MKIKFLIPGDIITLTENTQKPLECSDYPKREPYNGYTPQKGDQFKVSQVYIRNNGWFASSVTLKAVGGPILDALSANIAGSTLLVADKELAKLKDIKAKFDSLPIDTTWLAIQAQYLDGFPIVFTGAGGCSCCFHGHNSHTHTSTPSRAYQTKNGIRYGNDKMPSSGQGGNFIRDKLQGWRSAAFFFKTNLLNDIVAKENEIKKIKLRTKPYKVNSTVRLLLETIEEWEVEVTRGGNVRSQ